MITYLCYWLIFVFLSGPLLSLILNFVVKSYLNPLTLLDISFRPWFAANFHLNVLPAFLNGMQLPLEFRSVKLAVCLRINWTSLRVELLVNELLVDAYIRTDFKVNAAQEKQNAIAAQVAKLTAQLTEALPGPPGAPFDLVAKLPLISKVIQIVQVSVTNVHIRIEDTSPQQASCLGIVISRFGIGGTSTDRTWRDMFIPEKSYTDLSVLLERLVVYVTPQPSSASANSAASVSPPVDVDLTGLWNLDTPEELETKGKLKLLLYPLTFFLKVQFLQNSKKENPAKKRQTDSEEPIPHIKLEAILKRLQIRMTQLQYHRLLSLSTAIGEVGVKMSTKTAPLQLVFREPLNAQEADTYLSLFERNLNDPTTKALSKTEQQVLLEFEKAVFYETVVKLRHRAIKNVKPRVKAPILLSLRAKPHKPPAVKENPSVPPVPLVASVSVSVLQVLLDLSPVVELGVDDVHVVIAKDAHDGLEVSLGIRSICLFDTRPVVTVPVPKKASDPCPILPCHRALLTSSPETVLFALHMKQSGSNIPIPQASRVLRVSLTGLMANAGPALLHIGSFFAAEEVKPSDPAAAALPSEEVKQLQPSSSSPPQREEEQHQEAVEEVKVSPPPPSMSTVVKLQLSDLTVTLVASPSADISPALKMYVDLSTEVKQSALATAVTATLGTRLERLEVVPGESGLRSINHAGFKPVSVIDPFQLSLFYLSEAGPREQDTQVMSVDANDNQIVIKFSFLFYRTLMTWLDVFFFSPASDMPSAEQPNTPPVAPVEDLSDPCAVNNESSPPSVDKAGSVDSPIPMEFVLFGSQQINARIGQLVYIYISIFIHICICLLFPSLMYTYIYT